MVATTATERRASARRANAAPVMVTSLALLYDQVATLPVDHPTGRRSESGRQWARGNRATTQHLLAPAIEVGEHAAICENNRRQVKEGSDALCSPSGGWRRILRRDDRRRGGNAGNPRLVGRRLAACGFRRRDNCPARLDSRILGTGDDRSDPCGP